MRMGEGREHTDETETELTAMSERKPHVVVVGGGLVSLLLYSMTQFNAFVSMISYSAIVYNWGTDN